MTRGVLKRGITVWPVILAAAVATFPYTVGNASWTRQILLISVYGLLTIGLVPSFGYAGELQFGQIAMFAVGAYVSGALSVHAGIHDLLLLMIIGGAASAVLGLLIAAAALRLGGWALGMSSFFLVLMVPDIVNIFGSVSGGAIGLIGIPSPSLFGLGLSSNVFFVVAVITLCLWMAFMGTLLRSRYGGVLRISRESPVLAESLGLSVPHVKIAAYTLGAVPAGIAGCLFAYVNGFVGPSSFTIEASIAVLAAVIIGGSESIYGAVFGAAILQLGPFSASSFNEYASLVYGVFLIVIALVFRRGVSGLLSDGRRRLSTVVTERRAAHANSGLQIADRPLDAAAPEYGNAARERALLKEVTRDGRPLVVSNVSKRFGGVQALNHVSLVANPGEVTGLIGTNGSGKTTLLNVVSGVIASDEGEVTLGDHLLPRARGTEVARLGVARTFQTPSIPRGMSVSSVVMSARYGIERHGVLACGLSLPGVRRSAAQEARIAMEALAAVGLKGYAGHEASSLPLGPRRLVEIARCLAAGASVCLLDEPASGLSSEELVYLAQVLRLMSQLGIAVILVEHNFQFVMEIASNVVALHLGEVLAEGPPSVIRTDANVAASYLGATVEPAAEVGVER